MWITISLVTVLLTSCSGGAETRSLGDCLEVAEDEGCLEIASVDRFRGWVRVLPLGRNGGGSAVGRFFQLGNSEGIGSAVKAGPYRIEGFLGSVKPAPTDDPDCSGSIELRAGFGFLAEVEADKESCRVGPS